ncbi:hypothetical protein KSP35_18290 [Aquihabitans sp. G128]|uniref:hypothetical protein n=1 Tax=Aquihabitans sp. G128 TaxID=2849779 RepID=UPI001C219F84|nr:hypothetical protein [Aquihabitans sp. G128]QXC60266.1 hypothetical protein KSP35_18290 [Aquihabitans sp. G128]
MATEPDVGVEARRPARSLLSVSAYGADSAAEWYEPCRVLARFIDRTRITTMALSEASGRSITAWTA